MKIFWKTQVIVLLFVASAQSQLVNMVDKTKSQLSQIVSGSTVPSKNWFEDRLFERFVELTNAGLQRGYNAEDFATLAAAINRAESDTALVIVSTNKSLTATDTLRRTAALWVYKGGTISLGSGVNFLVQGHFFAGRYKVFEGSGTVTFADGSIDKFIPEWFGGIGDSSTASLAAFNSLLASGYGGTIDLNNRGKWLVSDSVLITEPIAIVGSTAQRRGASGPAVHRGPVIVGTSTSGAPTLVNQTTGSRFENFTLFGNRQNGHGLSIYKPGATQTMGDYTVNNVYSEYNGGDGFRFLGPDGCFLVRLNAQFNKGWGIKFVGPSGSGNGIASTLMDIRTRRNSAGGVYSLMNHGTYINVVCPNDTVGEEYATFMLQGNPLANRRTYGSTFIGTDVEQSIPSLANPSHPISNWQLQDISVTTFIGNFMGVQYKESSSYTTDAGTNTTTIVDAALNANVDDYYNGWYVDNSTRSVTDIKVTDYDAGTKTLTLTSAIAGQTTGDTYIIYKWPNRWITMDSVYSATFINNNFAAESATPDSGIVVGRPDGNTTFANMLFIGHQLTASGGLDPGTNIVQTSGGTANWGELSIDKSKTNGQLWLRSNRILSIQNTDSADVQIFNTAADGGSKRLRIYGDVDTTAESLNRQNLSIGPSTTTNNVFNVGTSTDSVHVGFSQALLMTGNDSSARFIMFQGEQTDPATPKTNYLKLFSRVDDDNLWIRTDNGDSSNLQKTQNIGDTLGVVLTAPGAATVARDGMNMVIDTFGAAASDTVVTLTGHIGDIVYIRTRNSNRDLTFLDSGNFSLAAERVLDNVNDLLVLLARTTTTWVEISFSDNQ